jgi:hypothetical protein
MSRKGHYSGGSTLIGPRDPTWFKKGSMRAPPNNSAPKPPLSLAEKAALQALKQSQETGSKLIPKGMKKRPQKRFGKAKTTKAKAPGIRPEPSEPNRATTEVRQAERHGRSRT